MPKQKTGGRVKTSLSAPLPFSQRDSSETEVKYLGLLRDEALFDIQSKDKALAEVLKDIQDPSEASTLGAFVPTDLQILDGTERFNLKKEDFEILSGASIDIEDTKGLTTAAVNPRQRISDRIGQAERFAGRGTLYQGQGPVLFKYYVPEDEPTGVTNKYSHTNPPPFFTEAITSSAENSPDFIPVTPEQIENTHRIGYVLNGEFIPEMEDEWWWNGEYNHEFRERAEYGSISSNALTDPKYPMVRDGNIKFDQIFPRGINSRYNWGLRFDTWMKKSDFTSSSDFMRWVVQVNGHLRIDYFDKTGYNSTTRAIEGSWKTALNTFDSSTYYVQLTKEEPVSSAVGAKLYYVQGGPSMANGQGTGTLPSQRSSSNGGAWDLSETYTSLEGNVISNFKGDYIPVVIRFWYGQPSKDPTKTDVRTNQPLGPASFLIDTIEANLSSADLSKWNDYSSQLRLTYNSTQSAWQVDTSSGGSASGEANFANFNAFFEVMAYTTLNASKPSALSGYTNSSSTIIAEKVESGGTTYAKFNIPGVAPANGQTVWVIANNRAYSVVASDSNPIRWHLWERYLFNPNFTRKYRNASDLLEGIGSNYTEPDPAKVPFQENLDLYKIVYGSLPSLNTYTSDRYDGTILNSVTSSNTDRDYDYNHPKLLMIGRQKKGTVSEIGTTAPYAGKNLASGEIRKKGENYTFIEVVKNEAGFGGSVVINAYPTNNLGVLSTTSTSSYGKMLHMTDNTNTFSRSNRQNISTIVLNELPSDANFASTSRVLYEEIGGQGRFSVGTWNGSAFTYDNTGIIAGLTMGANDRNHDSKSAFLTDFSTISGSTVTDYSFYGMIGMQRTSYEGVSLTVNSGGTTITSTDLFPNGGATSNNNQYIGTEIIFSGDGIERKITAYNASSSTVTFSPSITAGTYSCDVYYNHFQLGGTLPTSVVNSSGSKVTSALTGAAALSNRVVQIKYVFNSGYQFLRTDNGAGLSFSETLYVKQRSSATQETPFSMDTELPAPPADIVVPFGYDNTPGSSDNPGLGGLCYPPYSIQNIALQSLAVNDSSLYAAGTGEFDMWWGSRIGDPTDMGEKYLYVTDKLIFDFSNSERAALLSSLGTSEKPTFSGSEYTHKLEVELNVGLPSNATNQNIYRDALVHSDNKPVKDKYFLFIRKASGSNQLSVLSANNPSWT